MPPLGQWVPVAHARDAVEAAGLGGSYEQLLVKNPEACLRALKKVVLAPQSSLAGWGRVAEMADRLGAVGAEAQGWARLVAGIARRHDEEYVGNMVDLDWFSGLPEHERLAVLAQVCQQAASGGGGVPKWVVSAVSPVLEVKGLPSPLVLRVWGA